MLTVGPANYRVLYRTGGTKVWAWKPVLNRLSWDAATSYLASIAREGRFGIIVEAAKFDRIGIPMSYTASEYDHKVASLVAGFVGA